MSKNPFPKVVGKDAKILSLSISTDWEKIASNLNKRNDEFPGVAHVNGKLKGGEDVDKKCRIFFELLCDDMVPVPDFLDVAKEELSKANFVLVDKAIQNSLKPKEINLNEKNKQKAKNDDKFVAELAKKAKKDDESDVELIRNAEEDDKFVAELTAEYAKKYSEKPFSGKYADEIESSSDVKNEQQGGSYGLIVSLPYYQVKEGKLKPVWRVNPVIWRHSLTENVVVCGKIISASCSVGLLQFDSNSEAITGTCFLVAWRGMRLLVTAGHCVPENYKGNLYAYFHDDPVGHKESDFPHLKSLKLLIRKKDTDADIAVFSVPPDFKGVEALSLTLDDAILDDVNLQGVVIGYPGIVESVANRSFMFENVPVDLFQLRTIASATRFEVTKERSPRLNYLALTTQGFSGGPVILLNGAVAGVHCGGTVGESSSKTFGNPLKRILDEAVGKL